MVDGEVQECKGNTNVEANNESGIEKKKDEDADDRGQWNSQLEFILTCVGYAVGLGNVWRFPYLAYKNGGGAFLIPYFFMVAFCGIPVFFFEVCFGQFASLGPLAIWKANPMWRGVGLGMVTVSVFVSLYYQILIAYILFFFFASMNSELPWTDCDNHWNTDACLTADQFSNETYRQWHMEYYNLSDTELKTPSEEYYYREVLKMSEGIEDIGSIVWELACCLLIAWIVVYIVLLKGISSLGKVVYFTSTFPYVMMAIMVVRGCTLPGAGVGLEYYLKPDFSRLSDSVVWSDAAIQVFYSLSTCSGGLIAMASYNNFHNNAYRDSILVPLINCFTSLFAGLAIFSVLGYMAELKGVSVDEVADSGPGLIFVVYPEGLANMPVAPLWSLLFFFMMLTLGFSSQFSIAECVFVALMDQFPGTLRSTPERPMIFRGITIIIYYLISLPMVCEGGFYLFNIMDTYAGGFPRLFTGLCELIAIIWIYGLKRYSEDIAMMIGKQPNWYFKACWSFISPVLIMGIVLFKIIQYAPLTLFDGEYVYPDWAILLGWFMILAVVIWVPIWMFVEWCINGGKEIVIKTNKPLPDWGPAQTEDRTGRYAPEAQEFLDNQSQNRVSVTQIDMLNASFMGMGSEVNSNKNSYNVMSNKGFVF